MSAPRRETAGAAAGFVRVVAFISRVCGVAAAAMIVVSVLITCQLIFMRFVLNASTIWQTEAVTYLMIGATLIGLPYVQLLRGHVNVDLLPLVLPPAARRALSALVVVATLAVVGVMLWHGFELFHIAYERNWRSDTVWGVKLFIPYLALPLGFGLFALQLIADLVSTAVPDAALPGDGPVVHERPIADAETH